ncbi:TPA: Shiga toxin A subunit, partial [Salmonella enterica subsp. enterica serovar Dublin]|nr:Shiga toxin A subunit [Salmonella enterica subsp. enterica serovar Dublin]
MVCLLVGVPAISYAHDYGCATVGASMESSLFDAIKNDLNIDVATIIKDKTKVEILDISPVSKVYAESLARMDYEKDKAQNKVAI